MGKGNRWRDLLDDEKDIDCGPYCPGCFCPQKDSRLYDGARIALAATEWLEHYQAMPAPRSCEIAWAMTLLEEVLGGKRPAHNPPNQGPDGQKEGE